MKISEMLKSLAQGVNPETGEVLDRESLTNQPEIIRTLYALADEIATYESPKKDKKKLSTEERRTKNIEEGKPANSHFPWSDEEKELLAIEFEKQKSSIEDIAHKFERSRLAIAVQLEKLGLITADDVEVERYR